MLGGFRFFSPYWFALLPVAAAALWFAHRPAARPAAVFSSIADLKGLPVTFAQRFRRWLPFASGLGMLLLIAALARPQKGDSESRIFAEGLAIQMTIDVSGSMRAVDFQIEGENVDRLTAVKQVMKDFVIGSRKTGLGGRPDDAVGLVVFGGFADSKCPLTLDHGALLDVMDSLQIPRPVRDRFGNIVNMDALREELQTAIGDGITLSLDRFKDIQAKSKVLILLTDGDNNAGVVDPREAAKIAQTQGVKIYTIGIGRNGEVPYPVEDAFGEVSYQPARFPIDEELLKYIAETTGGKYFHASDTTGLAKVYAEIDKLEKTKVEQQIYTEYRELYSYLAIPGLFLLFAVAGLNATRFRALP